MSVRERGVEVPDARVPRRLHRRARVPVVLGAPAGPAERPAAQPERACLSKPLLLGSVLAIKWSLPEDLAAEAADQEKAVVADDWDPSVPPSKSMACV